MNKNVKFKKKLGPNWTQLTNMGPNWI